MEKDLFSMESTDKQKELFERAKKKAHEELLSLKQFVEREGKSEQEILECRRESIAMIATTMIAPEMQMLILATGSDDIMDVAKLSFLLGYQGGYEAHQEETK